jgi:hypothetical protein
MVFLRKIGIVKRDREPLGRFAYLLIEINRFAGKGKLLRVGLDVVVDFRNQTGCYLSLVSEI